MDSSDKGVTVKNVLVLYVGGTIGMTPNEFGVLSPTSNVFIERVRCIPQLNDNEYMEHTLGLKDEGFFALPIFDEKFAGKKYRVFYKIMEFIPLLDSSNMGVDDWRKIAIGIKKYYSEYNGFVVVHGTDTLVYTASALSFMFENLQKPIILTGSQLPIFHPRSDGIGNLQHSIIISGVYFIPEVCIFFGKFLLRGNRSVKTSTLSFNGFQSPNTDILASVDSQINMKLPSYKIKTCKECTLHCDLNANVMILVIFPEIPEKMINSCFEPPTEGVVLLTYGSGNIPAKKDYIIQAIRKATNRGIMVVNCSQCLDGSVNSFYETNKVLADNGVISAYDMTMEATYTKLLYVLSIRNIDYFEKKKLMESNLRGELTN